MPPHKKASVRPALSGPVIFPGMIGLGILLVLCSLALTLRAKHRLELSRQVLGIVVNVTPASNTSGQTQSYYPVIRAEDEEGQPFEITGSVSTSPPPTIGEAVKLAYPPGHPQDAFVIGLIGIWFLPVFVGGLGAIITLVGLILLFATSVPKAKRGATIAKGTKGGG